jgi:hypothetical protein
VTKEELISQLCNSKNNFILGLASLALLADPDAQNLLKEKSADLSGYSVPFDQVATLLGSACDRQVALEEFAKSVLRCLVKEGHELVTHYCKNEGLYSDLSAQSWWQFSRLVRNALSHDFCFRLNDKDLKLLPVSWQGKTLDPSVDGQPLMLSSFGYADAWRLFLEYESFVFGLSSH